MKIVYTVTASDIRAFHKFHLRNSKTVVLQRRILLTAAFLVVAASHAIKHLEDQPALHNALNSILNAGVLVAIVYVVMRVGIPASVRFTTLGLFRGKNRGVLCEHSLEINGDELVETTDAGGTITKLNSIEKICSENGYTFVYINSTAAHVIPEERVTQGNVIQFVSLLERRVAEHNSHENQTGSAAG